MIYEITAILDAEPLSEGFEALIFDLDDTLYSEKDYVRSGFCAVGALFPQAADMPRKLWAAFEKGKQAIDTVLAEYNLSDRKAEALRAYRFQVPEIALYPGVREMLLRMRETKKLGLITDGRPEGQRAKLTALRIEELFDEIIITDELGGPAFRKPNAAAFELMRRRLDVPYEAMAYVGDNMNKDFIAPEQLGMGCIYFKNPDGLYS